MYGTPSVDIHSWPTKRSDTPTYLLVTPHLGRKYWSDHGLTGLSGCYAPADWVATRSNCWTEHMLASLTVGHATLCIGREGGSSIWG